MPPMTAAQALAAALRAEGVEYVFGLPGGHSVTILYDELSKADDIQAILARHESAGAFAALGYAQVTGQAGVCQGTAGPGFSQMLVGIHEAWYAKLPLICIAPNAPIATHGKGALQEFDQTEQVTTVAKWWYRVDRPEKIPWVMRNAFNRALAPPCGPVLVDIPLDIGPMTAEMEDYRCVPRSRPAADPGDVQRAADLLVAAEQPVLICGRGVHQAAAYDEVRELAELLAMPVMTTNHGKSSLPENHPLCAGGVGCNRTLVSEALLEQADCSLWVGSQIEEFAVGKQWPPLPPGRKFINLNVDPDQFGRNWVPDVALLGDAKLALRQLINACKDDAGDRNFAHSDIAATIADLWQRYDQQIRDLVARSKGPVHPAQFLGELQQLMPTDAVVVLGEGANRVWTATQLRLTTPGTWVSASDFGCMGYAVGASIGAAFGRPGKQVVCLTGDGAFQMQMQEIVVAAQYRLPIIFVVFNNNCLAWIKWVQQRRYEGRYYCVDYEANWDHAAAAEAAGLKGLKVEHPEQCRPAIASALEAAASGQPALIEVMIPWDEPTPGFVQHHG